MSTWILLRGLTREARHWGDFPERLAERLPAARLLAVDLPGNGALYAQTSPTRVGALGEAVRAQLSALGAAPPYHLLAMSLGAMVAIDWALRHPGEISGAVLINTSLRGLNPLHHRLRPANYARLLNLVLSGDDAARERAILALTSRRQRSARAADALVERWCTYRRECPVSTCNALRQLLAAARFRAPSAPPPVPLLLLSGASDALVDARCSQRLAERWRVPLAVHPNAGHDLPLDDARWVVQAIEEWLAAPRA